MAKSKNSRTLMAEMVLEMQERDTQLCLLQEQNQKLQKLNSELSGLLNILPNTERTAFQDRGTENEDRTFGKRKSAMAELAQKLNSENSLLLKQNTELLNWNSR